MEKYNNFKKKYGQNFLFDKNLLMAICRDANITKDDDVLEIGTGEGTLTSVLSQFAKSVVSYEIDKELQPILSKKFAQVANVKLIFEDALKTDIDIIEKNFKANYTLVANIPYYITTPLIFKFLENSKMLLSMTLMVQKEVAERICAKPNTTNYGALSVVCQNFCDCKIMRTVSRKLFKPMPKVDSAIISMTKKAKFDSDFSFLVRSSFAMRRKTLNNNLIKAYNLKTNELLNIFENAQISPQARAETLSVEDFNRLLTQLVKFDIKD